MAIYEAVYNMMEAVVLRHDRLGMVRGPSGTTITGVVPTNTYPSRDGKYVIIGGNGDSIFRRLMHAAGRPDIAEDPELKDNPGRLAQQDRVDGAISDYTTEIRLGPRSPLAFLNRGILKTHKGDTRGAGLDFEESLRLSPRQPQAAKMRRSIHEWLGRPSRH